MKRELKIVLENDSWPKAKPPAELVKISGTQKVDIAEFLLTIGYCTVPSHSSKQVPSQSLK